jgi:hypothetical protein
MRDFYQDNPIKRLERRLLGWLFKRYLDEQAADKPTDATLRLKHDDIRGFRTVYVTAYRKEAL